MLYAFRGFKHRDGALPSAALIRDKAGNLYGTTRVGGRTCTGQDLGCGTIFRIAPDGTETVLHAFNGAYQNDSDGYDIEAGLIEDRNGNLYGTAAQGGPHGVGTAFELAPDGTLTVLYVFGDYGIGEVPLGGLVRDGAGNLYGTTSDGGAYRCGEGDCGTVFKLAPNGEATILFSFDGADGDYPFGDLIRDKAGNFYGTTEQGGMQGGKGTVFKLTADGTETTLYSFAGEDDGQSPETGVIRDTAGNLYGTTFLGGGNGCYLADGCGTAFKLAPDGTETVLVTFGKPKRDGKLPGGRLIKGADGRLYGTTSGGGDRNCKGGCGTVFRIGK